MAMISAVTIGCYFGNVIENRNPISDPDSEDYKRLILRIIRLIGYQIKYSPASFFEEPVSCFENFEFTVACNKFENTIAEVNLKTQK